MHKYGGVHLRYALHESRAAAPDGRAKMLVRRTIAVRQEGEGKVP